MCRRDLILTGKYLYLIGREQIKKGPEKDKFAQVIKRKFPFDQISHVSLSMLQVIIFLYHSLDYNYFLHTSYISIYLL